MLFRKNILYIYTDGSSKHKPRKGGLGIRYIYLDEQENEIRIDNEQFGFQSGSNNQMELKAVIEGIRQSSKQDISINYNCIEVRTDSRYVTEHKNLAVYNWPRNGWCNSNGRPIENAPLWKDLVKVMQATRCRIEFKWVKGHSKDPDNKDVDRMAKQSANSALNKPLFQTKLRRKKSEQKTKIGSVEMKGQRISIHIINDEYLNLSRTSKYRYEVISKGSEYYKKVDIIFSEHHHLKSGHYYYVILNTDNRNPRILKVIKELKKENNNNKTKE